MAKVTDGVKTLMESDLIPDATYRLRVNKVRPAGSWEVADLGFVNPEDPELVGRRLSYFIGELSTGNWRGLTDLLKSAQLLEVPKDKETGEQDTMKCLDGIEFNARVSRRDGKRGPENVVYPTFDNDWIAANLQDGSGSGGTEVKKRRRRRSSN